MTQGISNALLSVYLRQYPDATYTNIASRVSKDSRPEGKKNNGSDLFQFNINFIDPVDADGNLIILDTGDDIVITDDENRLAVYGTNCVGKILRMEKDVKGWSGIRGINRLPMIEFKLTCENRNFSHYPFTLTYEDAALLSVILDAIFLTNTVGLGGILTNGTVITRYLLNSPDVSIANYQFTGTAIEHLKEILGIIGYQFKIYFYAEQDSTNTVRTIAQVQIWQG